MANTMTMAISALVQAVIFLLIPLVWWLISGRKTEGFFSWLGWKKPTTSNPGRLWGLSLLAFTAFSLLGLWLMPVLAGKTATSEFAGLGWGGLLSVVLYALVKTAFSEESLFRGFLLKRVAAKFGFVAGNTVQAIVFGLLHALPLGAIAGAGAGLLAGLFAAAVGAAIGYLNERQAGGSILPGWCVHAAANLLAGVLALF